MPELPAPGGTEGIPTLEHLGESARGGHIMGVSYAPPPRFQNLLRKIELGSSQRLAPPHLWVSA